MDLIELDPYHRPRVCNACGGVMIFKGVGEYQCEDCKSLDYDDYGKVRLFIESHKGANATDIAEATGVTQKSIRQMLKDGRLEVASNSLTFLRCEICGAPIRYGRMCSACELNYHRSQEEKQRKEHQKNLKGLGVGRTDGDDGAKRFNWEKQ